MEEERKTKKTKKKMRKKEKDVFLKFMYRVCKGRFPAKNNL